jgi:hypothetical protein
MKKTIESFVTYGESIIAIALSFIAAIIGIFGGETTYLFAAVATALGFLSFGIIRDRKSRIELEEQISNLRRSFPDRPSAFTFFRKPPDIATFIQKANQIDLCGVTLTNTVHRQFPMLRERLESGGKLRLLLIDPSSDAIEMSSQRSTSPKDTEYYRRRLESALSDITYLVKYKNDQKKIRGRSRKLGSISVRFMSYAPSFGIISFDPRKKNSTVFVEIYPHKYGFKVPPTFDLTKENDGPWYDYFVDQFEQMWDSAIEWDSEAYLQKIPF